MRALQAAKLFSSRLMALGARSASRPLLAEMNACKPVVVGWQLVKQFSKSTSVLLSGKKQRLFETDYEIDEWTNLNESIKSKLNRNLLLTKYHPLNHLANKIRYFFYQNYTTRMGSPIFSIYDSFKPIVSTEQNFDRYVNS